MSMSFVRHLGAVSLLAMIAVLAGCASPANKESMSAVSITPTRTLPYTVNVQARGGAETGAMDSSNVSNSDLKQAIEASITNAKLFKAVVQGHDGDYELMVTVTQLTKPIFGASFTVTMEAGWALTKVSDKTVVMRKLVRSSHTAQMSDSMVGVTRLRLAVEGAVRNNITQGLQEIMQLPL